MDEQRDPSRATWVAVVTSVVAVGIGGRFIERYGWVDGTLRGLAVALLVQGVLMVVLVDVEWARRPVAVMIGGEIGFGVLYLAGSFVLGEPGPGGVLCVAALVLFAIGLAVASALQGDLRRQARAGDREGRGVGVAE